MVLKSISFGLAAALMLAWGGAALITVTVLVLNVLARSIFNRKD